MLSGLYMMNPELPHREFFFFSTKKGWPLPIILHTYPEEEPIPVETEFDSSSWSEPGGIRTHDLLIRRVTRVRSSSLWVSTLRSLVYEALTTVWQGSLSEVSAYPRMVAEAALNYNAHSVLLTHVHPGGTCAPSPEDISSTLQRRRLLNSMRYLRKKNSKSKAAAKKTLPKTHQV